MKTLSPHHSNPCTAGSNSCTGNKKTSTVAAKALATLSLLSVLLTSTGTLHAQIITNTDTAANYGGLGEPGWTNGANAGSGFGSWNLFISGSAGNFLGSSSAQGFGNINTDGQSFGMYGNPTGNNYSNAERSFSSALNVGDTFSIDLAVAFRNGNKGISLFSGGFAPANEVWNFNVGGDNYTAGGSNLGWTYSQTSVFSLTATQISSTQLGISLVRGSDSYATNLIVTTGLSGFRAYVGSTEAGNDLNNLFINNLTTVVPEPSTYALLALSAIGLAGYAARRRARK